MNRRIVASVAALLMAAVCLTGCSGKDNVKVTVNSGGNSAVNQIKDLGPGEEFSGKLGEEFKYEKSKIDVKLIEVGQTSPVTANGERCYAFIFNAVNNSDKDLNIWMLDSIKISIDGEDVSFGDTFSAVSAANAAMKYEEYQKFDDTVKAGESLTGYIPFEIKGEWMNMKLEYKPDSENSNDFITYEIAFEDVVNKYE